MSAAGRRLPRWNEPGAYYEQVESYGVTMLRSARLAGFQTVLGALCVAAVLPLVPPTEAIGEAGWVGAAAFLGIAFAGGVWLLWRSKFSAEQHLALLYVVLAAVSSLNWLAGGVETPYLLLYAITSQHIAVHPLRRAAPFAALMAASICLAFVYTDVDASTAALIAGLAPTLLALAASMGYSITRFYAGSVARGIDEATGRTEAELARREAESARSAARRLRELDQMKEGFVSTVSHELRSPLTSVKGYLEAMLDGEVGELSPLQTEYAEIVHRNSGRLQGLVDDLLVLSRMEAGRLKLDSDRFDLVAAVRGTCADARAEAAGPVPAIEFDAPEELEVAGDRRRIERAIGSLVSNALKYGRDGGAVRVRILAVVDEAVVEVIDRGVGIPAAELDRVGERFFRASTAGTQPGSGLGLAIAREIVLRHGGELEVESVESSGSTFRIRLPLGTDS